jgi:hypothetical protein
MSLTPSFITYRSPVPTVSITPTPDNRWSSSIIAEQIMPSIGKKGQDHTRLGPVDLDQSCIHLKSPLNPQTQTPNSSAHS